MLKDNRDLVRICNYIKDSHHQLYYVDCVNSTPAVQYLCAWVALVIKALWHEVGKRKQDSRWWNKCHKRRLVDGDSACYRIIHRSIRVIENDDNLLGSRSTVPFDTSCPDGGVSSHRWHLDPLKQTRNY